MDFLQFEISVDCAGFLFCETFLCCIILLSWSERLYKLFLDVANLFEVELKKFVTQLLYCKVYFIG
jgi:hypothetical protein